MRDVCAVDKFLLKSAAQTEELKTQMARIMRMDLNNGSTVEAMAVEFGQARVFADCISDNLRHAQAQLDKIGGR